MTGTRSGWFSPETFTTTGATSQYLIQEAYQLEERRILGAPSWVKSERYDIKAKVPNAVAEELRTLDNHQQYDQSNAICFGMLRNLLTDHFKLAVHREIKELPMFALIIAKEGLKLHEAEPGDTYPDGIKDLEGKGHGGVMDTRSGQLIGQGISISDLVKMLSQQELGLPVIDKTGLTGKYDFTLKWTPNGKEDSIFTAIQEQLGLKLEPQEGPVEFLVIDNMERPSEN